MSRGYRFKNASGSRPPHGSGRISRSHAFADSRDNCSAPGRLERATAVDRARLARMRLGRRADLARVAPRGFAASAYAVRERARLQGGRLEMIRRHQPHVPRLTGRSGASGRSPSGTTYERWPVTRRQRTAQRSMRTAPHGGRGDTLRPTQLTRTAGPDGTGDAPPLPGAPRWPTDAIGGPGPLGPLAQQGLDLSSPLPRRPSGKPARRRRAVHC